MDAECGKTEISGFFCGFMALKIRCFFNIKCVRKWVTRITNF